MNAIQFKIEQKLNESGTTIVYRAFDEMLHRTVLLKVLHKHLANDADLRERFVREARACAALRSEHIVQVYDLTEIDGAPAIVMEFVDGQSLKDVIAAGQNRTPEFSKKVGIHVLRALSIAHARGIIHRDIKPGNILVSDSGSIKVTDFGLAYVALSPTVTMEGMVLGTPAYMAPEQIRGDEIDSRTDLFALGVTLIEVLTGERIFEGSTYTECMKKVLAFKTDELKRFEIHSDADFSLFLHKLLAPNKKDRFQSSAEALQVIDEKRSSIFNKPAVVTKRKKLWPIGIGAVAVMMIAIFGWPKLSQPVQVPNNEIPSIMNPASSDSAAVIRVHPIDITTNNVKIVDRKSEPENKERILSPIVLTDSGKVYVTSTPWAKVYVNNQLIGETPIAKPIILAAGNNTIMFSNPSFDPIMKTIMVESNREMTVEGNFIDHVGYLRCIVTPWAEVYVDEQYKDTTPLSKPMMLSSGKHTVRFKNASFPDIVKNIAVNAKDTTHITVEFK